MGRRRKRRKKARDFGDNPKVRRGRDAKNFDFREYWERHYRGVRKKTTYVRPHYRTIHGKRVRVKGHIRRLVK